MWGTIANTAAIAVGSLAGAALKQRIGERQQHILFQCIGLAAMGIGITNIAKNMPGSEYPVLFIVSLCCGSLLGYAWDIDRRFMAVTEKYASSKLGEGLSTAILLFCIGTLSILGPIQSAVQGDNTFLYTNATLDLISSAIFAATYGIGIMAAGAVLFCWQGFLYLLAGWLSGFLEPALMTELSMLGGFLLLASGLSILKLAAFKTMNMLPSLLVPVLWFLGKSLLM